MVNFIRRAEPGVKQIKERLKNGYITGPFDGTIWYSRGLSNSAIHFIDLITHWLEDTFSIKIVSDNKRVWDGNDPEPKFLISNKYSSFFFSPHPNINMNFHHAEIFAKNGRLVYGDGGRSINWAPHQACSLGNKGIEAFSENESRSYFSDSVEIIPNELELVQFHVVNELAKLTLGKQTSLCIDDQAILPHQIIEKIRNSLSD